MRKTREEIRKAMDEIFKKPIPEIDPDLYWEKMSEVLKWEKEHFKKSDARAIMSDSMLNRRTTL